MLRIGHEDLITHLQRIKVTYAVDIDGHNLCQGNIVCIGNRGVRITTEGGMEYGLPGWDPQLLADAQFIGVTDIRLVTVRNQFRPGNLAVL